jgi:hypothetical protein
MKPKFLFLQKLPMRVVAGCREAMPDDEEAFKCLLAADCGKPLEDLRVVFSFEDDERWVSIGERVVEIIDCSKKDWVDSAENCLERGVEFDAVRVGPDELSRLSGLSRSYAGSFTWSDFAVPCPRRAFRLRT